MMRGFSVIKLGIAILTMVSMLYTPARSVAAATITPDSDDAIEASMDTIGVHPVGTAAQAFLNMPSKVLELLNRDSRLDILEYIKAKRAENPDSMPTVSNSLGGISRLVYPVTDDYLAIQVTPVSLLQFRLLYPRNKKEHPVVAVAYTLTNSTTSADSEVAFYDDTMHLLDVNKYLKLARLEDFLILPKDKKHLKEDLLESVPFPMIEYTLSPDAETLTAKLSTGDILGIEQQERIQPYLRPFITYSWDGHKFKLDK